MIRFGMIGGLGAFASVRLYDLINREAAKLVQGEIEDTSFPDLTIRQVPFASTDRFGNVQEELFFQEVGEGLDSLVSAGVTHVSFACNTLNGFFEKAIAENGNLEYISTVNETIKGINEEKGFPDTPIAVLTSKNAVNLGIYRENSFLRPIIEPHQELVDDLIYQSMRGQHYGAKDIFDRVMKEISAEHPSADVLLGCTELSVYSDFYSCNKKYDSIEFTAKKIARIHNENP
jgi:aspartate/glutamate racemase